MRVITWLRRGGVRNSLNSAACIKVYRRGVEQDEEGEAIERRETDIERKRAHKFVCVSYNERKHGLCVMKTGRERRS